MIATINFGLHTHSELSKLPFELITIFKTLSNIVKKLGYIWGDLLKINPFFNFYFRIDITDL